MRFTKRNRRAKAPYLLQQTSKGCVILDRDYKPMGQGLSYWPYIDYETCAVDLQRPDAGTAKLLSSNGKGFTKEGELFLYQGEEWRTAAYRERLKLLVQTTKGQRLS